MRAAAGAIAEGAFGCVFFLAPVCAEPLQTAIEDRAAQPIARANGDILSRVQYTALREDRNKFLPEFSRQELKERKGTAKKTGH